MRSFLTQLPKAELHVHFDGIVQPAMMQQLAERNKVSLPSVPLQINQAIYQTGITDHFLSIFDQVKTLIKQEQDFYDITKAYLKSAVEQGIVHTELSFDVQSYMQLNIPVASVIEGIHTALIDGQREWGISGYMLLCFLRHMSPESALMALEATLPYRDSIRGVGLAGRAIGNPPIKFKEVFAQARKYGYALTIHAGEEDGPDAIWQALKILQVDRIDHGIRSIEDSLLVKELVHRQIPLTICPISNRILKVYPSMKSYPFLDLLRSGVLISINSDDPALFNADLLDNYEYIAQLAHLTQADFIYLAENSIKSSFLQNNEKQEFLNLLQKKYPST